MYRGVFARTGVKLGRKVGGFTRCYEVYNYKSGRSRREGQIGVIYLCLPFLNTEVLTHELFHIVAHWAFLVKVGFSTSDRDDEIRYGKNQLLPVNSPEETMAYAIGECADRVDHYLSNHKKELWGELFGISGVLSHREGRYIAA